MHYDSYFTGCRVEGIKGRQASTKIAIEKGWLKPDAIFSVLDTDRKAFLFCVEYHNGDEVKRIEQQLQSHVSALKIGSPSQKYDLTIGHRVLNIFRKETVMHRTLERVQNNVLFHFMGDHFLFIALEEFKQMGIYADRKLINATGVNIFGEKRNVT